MLKMLKACWKTYLKTRLSELFENHVENLFQDHVQDHVEALFEDWIKDSFQDSPEKKIYQLTLFSSGSD